MRAILTAFMLTFATQAGAKCDELKGGLHEVFYLLQR